MAASTPTITLITGPNRGLGHGFLKVFASRPNSIIIAAVRNPSSAASQNLLSLPTGDNSQIKLINFDASIEQDAPRAAESLQKDHGIEYLDQVIANAGIGDTYTPLLEADLSDVRRHMDVNLFGVLALIKATAPLLRKSSKSPKMVFLGSGTGSFAKTREWVGPWYTYAVTKTAIHYTMRQLHMENEWLVSVAVDPAWVKTEGSVVMAKKLGMEPPLSVEEAVEGCVKVIDQASREKFSGELVEYTEKITGF